jgi:hypothetical protein
MPIPSRSPTTRAQLPSDTIVDFAKKAGTYTIKYTVTDASGLTSAIERTIIVVDKTAPIIRLRGDDNTKYVELKTKSGAENSPYVDSGATCKDYMNALLKPTMSPHDVDQTVVGTYFVTYACEDPSGNKAVEQTRKVIVRDTMAPRFTMALGGGVMTEDESKLATHVGDIDFSPRPRPPSRSAGTRSRPASHSKVPRAKQTT